MHSQALRLRSTINTLLNLSQIEPGWISVDRQDFDLAELARRVTADLAPAANGHHCDVQFDADARGVRADRDKISEVFHNLLDNAIKYSPDGGAIVVQCAGAAGGKVVVAVRDPGVGIREDDIKLLFSPYERGSAEDRGLASGTGLGLYIVKSLIELHGGEVWVESELGVGTSFFTLDPAEIRELGTGGRRGRLVESA